MTETRTLTFAGARGDRLAGRLDLPDGKPRAVVLVAHRFSGGNAGLAAAQIARSFSELNMAVLSLDFARSRHGGKNPASDTFSLRIDDLALAAAQLRSTMAAPSILVGHSLGGAAVLAIAAQVPEARAVVTLATPTDAAQVADLGQIGDQVQRQRIATLRRALLVIHSPDDEVVSFGNARVIFEAARHPKSFISLDGADHLLTRPADAAYAASVMAAWAARYLPAPEGPDSGTLPSGSALHEGVVVTESDAHPYGQRISVGGHELVADEPAAVGGADSGPTPYDLLLAGLGACTAITVRMYADRKGWRLRHITVRLRHRRIHAKDCAGCETRTDQLDQIDREMQFEGELTAEQRARLLDIAERCPVHRTLHSEVLVSTAESVPDGPGG
ncbi:MAG: OsmC family protein [Streptosporangiaceae bacterium]